MNPTTQSATASRPLLLAVFLLALLLTGCAIPPRAATHASPAIVSDPQIPRDWPVIAPFDNPLSVPFPPPYQLVHNQVHGWGTAALRDGERLRGWGTRSFLSPSARFFVIDHPHDNYHDPAISNDPTNISLVRRRLWVVDGQKVTSFIPPFAAWQVDRSAPSDQYVVTTGTQDRAREDKSTSVKVFRILPDRADELTIEPPFAGRSTIYISPAGLCVSFGEDVLHFGKIEGSTIRSTRSVALAQLGGEAMPAFRKQEAQPVWSDSGKLVLLGGNFVLSLETGQIIATVGGAIEIKSRWEAGSLFIGRVRGESDGIAPPQTLFIGSLADDGTIRLVRSAGRWSDTTSVYGPSPHGDRVQVVQELWGFTLIPAGNRFWGFANVDDLRFNWFGVDVIRTDDLVGWIPRPDVPKSPAISTATSQQEPK